MLNRDSSPINYKGSYEIDSLQYKIDSLTNLRDSVEKRIDTVFITIEKTRIQYEKDSTDIVNNTTSEDYVFFCGYVGRYDSIHNSSAIKNY